MKKTFVTVTGIRPDFIRMSEIFKKLDQNFNHIMVHTGQHFDTMLSDVFFKNLNIRVPDYNLHVGGYGKEHFHQTAESSVKLIELLRKIKNVDGVIFLGDSNSVVSSVAIKKEGYRIIHIEAGMRSGDKRMLEEINLTVCDSVSDILFVYHKNYKTKLLKENIPSKNIHVVGNTIVEIIKNKIFPSRTYEHILVDIHRPENFLYKDRMENLLKYIKFYKNVYNFTILFLEFPRTVKKLKEFNIYDEYKKTCICIPLQTFEEYLHLCRRSIFLISDSGTAQEEPALLDVPVIVPRDFTERPESLENHCSIMLNINEFLGAKSTKKIDKFIKNYKKKKKSTWLGNGKTSNKIIEILSKI
jgi:UDP-N-acetylglucosamine 2-epimerase (non-hydrolysing)